MSGFEIRDIHKKHLSGIEPNLCSKNAFRLVISQEEFHWKIQFPLELGRCTRLKFFKLVKLEIVFEKDRPQATVPGCSELCSPWSRRLLPTLPRVGGWVMLLEGDILQQSRNVI